MITETFAKKEILLRLATDYTIDYNASSLGKEIGISRVGAFKALKELEKEKLVKGKKMGKSTFYTLELNDPYVKKNVELLLMEKSRAYQRWINEFEELYKYTDIIILFGSIIKNEEKAGDIDLLLVYNKKNNEKVDAIIKAKNQILTKKIHPIKQTGEDLISNLKKKDKILISAIKEGLVLHGYDDLVEVIFNVTRR